MKLFVIHAPSVMATPSFTAKMIIAVIELIDTDVLSVTGCACFKKGERTGLDFGNFP